MKGKFAGAALRKSDSADVLAKITAELTQQAETLLATYKKQCTEQKVTQYFNDNDNNETDLISSASQVAVESVITQSLDAKDEICNLASAHKADLLVMGRRGSSSLVRYTCFDRFM